MKKLFKTIDTVNELMGTKLVKWLAVLLVLVVTGEVFMRFVLNRPTTQGPMIAIWTGCIMYALSWGYIHLHKGHVRVDIVYGRFSPRGKAIFDIICFIIFLLPFISLMSYAGFKWTWYAWSTWERTQETYWYPITGPTRTLLFIGIALFTLQAIAQFIRDIYFALRNKAYD
jgi:TRAP-type mannitol/chloroaromatic compound transport system permease small subunit